MKFLLTGRNGQVGWELERSLASVGEVIAFDRQTLDLEKPDQIVACVRETRPDVIVNAAAYTAVDLAEKESDRAMAINGTAPGILAGEAKRLGSLLVHYSTDYVFDGEKGSPYTEEDLPNPISVYGKTKLAGERSVQASGCRHLMLRTSWVYSARGHNFLLTMLRLAKERPELRVVEDQRGSPSWAGQIAVATARVLQDADVSEGTFHLSAASETTWFGFAGAILERSGLRTPVLPISSSDYPMAATRPAYSVLDNTKFSDTFGFPLPDWSVGLDQCLASLREQAFCDG